MTPERMDWSGDERLYQPRIHSRYIRELHRISEATGKPMTVLVNLAMKMLVDTHNGKLEWRDTGNGERIDSTQLGDETPPSVRDQM